jgi:hypothetical protein
MSFDRTGRQIAFPALLTLVIASCGCSLGDAALNSPAVNSGSANFSTVVSLGNSLTAGFADGALGEAGQKFSYPSLIAKQMGAAFNQPIIKEPGIGLDLQGNPAGRMQLISLSPPLVSSLPLNGPPQVISPPPYNNFAVPGANTEDVLTSTSGGIADLILQNRGTQVRQAKAARPTFIIAWIGDNDVLAAALLGIAIDGVTLTPTNDFSRDYTAIIDSLLATGAKIVVANIPDVTLIPFVTTLKPYVVDLQTLEPIKDPQGRNIPLLGTFSDGSIGPLSDDPSAANFAYITLVAAGFIAQGVGIPQGIGNGTGQPLPTFGVLDKAEVAPIKTRVGELNSIISAATTARGIPIVDINNLLKQIHAGGVSVGGIHLTTDYITGGIFSLDAVHPTPVGYGIVANAFIKRINEYYGSTIQEVNLAELVEQGSLAKSLTENKKANPYFIPSEVIEGMIRTITARNKI